MTFLQEARMDEVANLLPTTIENATKGTPIVTLMSVVDRKNIEAFIAIELTKVASMVNVDERLNLQPHQIPLIAEYLVETYKRENLADFKIAFTRGAMGKYDDKLLRVDAAIISNWMTKYLEEKYEVLVSQLNAEKENPYAVSRGAKTEIMIKLMKDALGDYKSPDEIDQKKEAEYRLKVRDEMKKRKEIQKHINRTASEFYKDRDMVNVCEFRDDATGYYVPAENLQDAEMIYSEALSRI
ncbi:MAG TPA: hypothetical protein VD927_12755 [Chryseosolibacter sp.]|nr:hypothetical protein [Chryseosolibacter sp.]